MERLAWELRQLRDRSGAPSYRALAKASHYSASTLAEAAKGERLPSLAVVLAYVRVCGGEQAEWEARWRAASRAIQTPSPAEGGGSGGTSECGRVHDPYLGLTAFDAGDADVFFGRSELVEELLECVGRHRLTVVVGPSGSGKSSLLRAGVLPRLDEPWRTVLLIPGEHPVQALARAVPAPAGRGAHGLVRSVMGEPAALRIALATWLVSRPQEQRLVLVIDQFEELFTLCTDDAERAAFLAALAAAAAPTTNASAPHEHTAGTGGDEDSIRIVLSVRADFYDRCAAHPALAEAVRLGARVQVGPPGRAELRDIIAEPAARAGVMVDPDLLAAVVAEAADQPGALPLLAHALREAWTRRRGNVLRLTDYQATGGVRGAVTQTAETMYTQLPAEHQQVMRALFLRLTAPGEGTEDTRRRLARAELEGLADPGTIDDLLHRLASARLIVLADGTVDVAHEAVIRAWPRLRHWLDSDRDSLRTRRRLTRAALTWHELHRDAGALYRGAQLADAQGWSRSDNASLNELESAFLATSTAADCGRGRRRRTTIAALAVLTALSLVLAVIAVVQREHSDTQRRIAVSQERAAQSRQLLQGQPEAAALVALEGYRVARTAEARGSLVSASSAYFANQFTGHTDDVTAVAYAPDGRTLATGSADRTVKLWDTATHRALVTLMGHTALVAAITFSPDGRTLATAGADRTLRLWDVASRRTTSILMGHTGALWAAVFSPDGRTVATAGADQTARIWDVASHRLLASLTGHSGSVRAVAFTPDGRTLFTASADRTVKLWDTATHRVLATLAGHTGTVGALAISPDGRTLATAGDDATVRLWDIASRAPAAVLRGHTLEVSQVAFTGDGRTLATIGHDSTVALWDVAGRRRTAVFHEANASLPTLALSPDGRELATTAVGHLVHAWDLGTRRTTATFPPADGIATVAAYAPDGRAVAIGRSDGSVTSWTTTSPRPLVTFTGHTQELMSLAYSPDGLLLATASADRTVRLWNVASGRPVATLDGHTGPVSSVAFSPDGRTLVTSSYDTTVRLWDVATHRCTGELKGHTSQVSKAVFAPGGRTVASAGFDRTVRLWDPDTHHPLAVLSEHTGAITALAYSPDGTTLATGGDDATVRLWSTTQNQTFATLTGHTNSVLSAAYSRDGRTLASTDADGTVRLWDTGTRQATAVLVGHTSLVNTSAFSPDRSTLLTTSLDGSVRLWDTDADRIADGVCELSRANHWPELLPSPAVGDVCR